MRVGPSASLFEECLESGLGLLVGPSASLFEECLESGFGLLVGPSASLFEECLESARRRRWALGDLTAAPSEEIRELEKEEKKIIQTLMKRAELASQAAETGINAFWDPMARVEGLEAQVAADFEELTQ
ncbi:ribosomal protein S18 domain containing protein, putative [Eimeria brunetti]|uniref:Ribosomal protein S18 domain containing protein, putative n=1 Tax=Eimeria brunetti TaxID=51314 RepID=U6LFM5_9EIME|nr:ribosomal protein S18 domain containing protein, putative [Eimeria brunetti]